MPAAGLHASAPVHSRLAASPNMMSELDLGASVIRGAAVLPTMYALMSLNEYMTHRYFQHLEFNRPDSLLWLKAIIAKVTGDAGTPERLVSFFNAVAEARVAAKPDSGMAPYVGKGGDMVAALAAFKDDAAVQAAGAKLKASMTA